MVLTGGGQHGEGDHDLECRLHGGPDCGGLDEAEWPRAALPGQYPLPHTTPQPPACPSLPLPAPPAPPAGRSVWILLVASEAATTRCHFWLAAIDLALPPYLPAHATLWVKTTTSEENLVRGWIRASAPKPELSSEKSQGPVSLVFECRAQTSRQAVAWVGALIRANELRVKRNLAKCVPLLHPRHVAATSARIKLLSCP